jgi:cell cycle sensor histidine kinase DivJ
LFTQILVNLLSNAIKFTCRGGSVAAGVKAEADSLLIEVTDTGIGIPADDLDRLGDPFFQATSLLERQHKGTGLGLSIVRGLVGVLGGEIVVASEPGKGTCVRVCLPMDCRGFASEPGISAKIKTISRLPAVNQPDLYKPVVRKIA